MQNIFHGDFGSDSLFTIKNGLVLSWAVKEGIGPSPKLGNLVGDGQNRVLVLPDLTTSLIAL